MWVWSLGQGGWLYVHGMVGVVIMGNHAQRQLVRSSFVHDLIGQSKLDGQVKGRISPHSIGVANKSGLLW